MAIRRRAAVSAATAGLLLLVSGAVAWTARAAGESLGSSLLHVTGSQVEFGVCLSPGDALPARLTGTYTVSRAGVPVTTVDWSDPEPSAVLVDVTPCPAHAWAFAVDGLLAGATYTIDIAVTLAPRMEQEDPDDAFAPRWVVDPSRSEVSLSTQLVVTAMDPPGDGGEDAGGGGPAPTASPHATPSGQPSATPTASPSASPSASGSTPVIIAHPAAFGPRQLAQLSPEEVASIAPATFGRLPAATVAALRPAQAAELTAQQAAAIRPSRASALRPRAVAALSPSAVTALSPDALAAMRTVQLRALTAAQVRALTPAQVRALSPSQRAQLGAARARSGNPDAAR